MKNLKQSLILIVAASLGVQAAKADEVDYHFTGTFSLQTPLSAHSAPNGAFSLEFLTPESVANNEPSNQPFNGSNSVLSGSYTFGGVTETLSSGSYSFFASLGNQSTLTMSAPDGDIQFQWRSLGQGSVSSLIGRPDASGFSHATVGNLGNGSATVAFEPFSGPVVHAVTESMTGTGTLVPAITPVPEPSTVTLAGLSLISLGGLAWGRCRRVFA